MRLNRTQIAALIPHAGDMVLLDEVLESDESRIVCRAVSHRDTANPLAIGGTLSSVCGIEFAAQAMAVHGGLLANAQTSKPSAGFLASVRNVEMHVERLDDVPGDLTIEAVREAGDATNVLYRFEVRSGAERLVTGRAAVVLRSAGSP